MDFTKLLETINEQGNNFTDIVKNYDPKRTAVINEIADIKNEEIADKQVNIGFVIKEILSQCRTPEEFMHVSFSLGAWLGHHVSKKQVANLLKWLFEDEE